MERQIEICTGSYYDCLQAEKGGAKRVELNSALHLGGLTPSVGSLILVKRDTNLKVITMIRPRAAGFHYTEEEFEQMLFDTDCMLENGADGVAFGCLDEAGGIDLGQSKQIIDKVKAKGKEVVFHRAFDCVSDPYQAIEQLIELGVDRILTSGLKAKAMDGMELLKDLQEKYGDRIQLLAGSGMNAENAVEMMEKTGISQVHSSCKGWLKDPTTMGKHVTFAYAGDEHEAEYEVVDAAKVEELMKCIR